MTKMIANDRDVVIPGELLAEGMDYLPSGKAFRDREKIYSSAMGLVSLRGSVIKVIPLAGKYMPKKGDVVIAKVTGISSRGWQLDVGAPYNADLNIADASSRYIDTRRNPMSDFFDVGDYVLCEIYEISEAMYIKLTAKERMYGRLEEGNIINVSPTKIPRIIGKQGSMIRLIKDGTKCDITVGQNGLVWIRGEPENEMKAATAVKMVEQEAHKQGLTDRVKAFLGGTK